MAQSNEDPSISLAEAVPGELGIGPKKPAAGGAKAGAKAGAAGPKTLKAPEATDADIARFLKPGKGKKDKKGSKKDS